MSASASAVDGGASSALGQCAVCSVDAALKCTACRVTFYCGVDHQRQHWKSHKPHCQHPYEVAETPELGRHLIATRDIAARSLIFVEAPLVVGPKWSLEEFEKEVPVFPCVGCFRPVQIGRAQCVRCTWPVCSPDCAGLHDHARHALECGILSLRAPPKHSGDMVELLDFYRSDALFALRAILLQIRSPEQWAQLNKLQHHDEERKGTHYYAESEERIVSYLQHQYLDRMQAAQEAARATSDKPPLLADCNATLLHRICGIIEVNAMNITLDHGLEIGALYSTASLLEHSCLPNCTFTFERDGGFRISMLAGRDIRRGEHLSIMYTHMLWGTQMRLEHLRTNKYFECRCARCVDPTELRTYLSAMRCIGDADATCTGILLPGDPHAPNGDWLCDRCPARLENEQMAFVLANIEEEVDGLLLNKDTTVDEVESLIAKLSQFLHPNHYHMFALRHSLVQMYGGRPGYEAERLSEEQLCGKIEMCKSLLQLVDVIDPHAIRLSLYIAIVLYELHSAVVEVERRRQVQAKKDGERYDYDALYVAEAYLVRAKHVLENSSDTPQGQKFVESIVRASETLETMFDGIRL